MKHFGIFQFYFLFQAISFAVCSIAVNATDHSIDLSLVGTWKKISFYLNVIETFSNESPDLYGPLIAKLLGLSVSIESEEDEYVEDTETIESNKIVYYSVQAEEDFQLNEKSFYEYAVQLFESESEHNKFKRSLLDIKLANKFYTPRIESHYQYYQNEVIPEFESKLKTEDLKSSWLYDATKYFYTNPEDTFALKTVSRTLEDKILLPFDRVIGKSGNIFILYGHFEDPVFKQFFTNLYQLALNGDLRIVWRYTPDISHESDDSEFETLGGYGIDLTLKRTDYIVVDDRGFTKEQQEKLVFDSPAEEIENSRNINSVGDITLELLNEYSKNIHLVEKEKLSELGVKLVKIILDLKDKGRSPNELLSLLKSLILEFPKHSHKISNLYNDEELELDPESESHPESELSKLKDKLSDSKLHQLPTGFYFNGAPISENNLNLYEILKVLERELNYINSLKENLGLESTEKLKQLMLNFSQYINQVESKNLTKKRYNVDSFENAIIYFNDIESDRMYAGLRTPKIAYKAKPTFGQVPQARSNIHDLVFAIHFSSQAQLYYLLQTFTVIMNYKIPQRVGVIPLIDNELDEKITKEFISTVNSKGPIEGMKLLIAIYEEIFASQLDQAEIFKYLETLEIPDAQFDLDKFYKPTKDLIENLSITQPSIISNGVFIKFTDNWQNSLAEQLDFDCNLLFEASNGDKIRKGESYRNHLMKGSLKRKVPILIPDDFSKSYEMYKQINDIPKLLNLFKNYSIIFDKPFNSDKSNDIEFNNKASTLTVIGSFYDKNFISHIITALNYLKSENSNDISRLRILNTSNNSEIFKQLEDIKDIELAVEFFENISSKFTVSKNLVNQSLASELSELFDIDLSSITPSSTFMFISGRFIDTTGIKLKEEDLESLMEFEIVTRLGIINTELIGLIKSGELVLLNTNDDLIQVSEIVSMILTSSYFYDDGRLLIDESIKRLNFSVLKPDEISHLILPASSDEKDNLIDIDLVIDPTTEYAQKLISMISLFDNMSFIKLRIHFVPDFSEKAPLSTIKRLYKGVYPSKVEFDENNHNSDNGLKALFTNVPETALFTLDVDVPQSWIVTIKEAETDLDNVKLDISGSISGIYELKNILIEGHAREGSSNVTPRGLSIEISNKKGYSDTNVMANLGYFQLKANPGLWDLQIREGTKSSEIYSLVEIYDKFISLSSKNNFAKEKKSVKLSVLDLSGREVYPIFLKKKGQENEVLVDLDPTQGQIKKSSNLWKSWSGKLNSLIKPKNVKPHADINIFTVASGRLYERFLGIMMASVMKHTEHTVKFWLIENYMSPLLKKDLPKLSEYYGFEYELITYKWPSWLRGQREKQRTIWGYKILFLDVLFPQDLDKVIFVDSDQIVRTDMKELVDLDLHGAPYGYTPMGDSRKEMEGFRFWKQGYWAKLLGDDMKYHISALYVIDLQKFRSIGAGDRLRQHYHALSADPNSLSNLDQDLPNDLQDRIKIYSLPQEWLWCETWCDDESLKKAKTIDLCNNPLTKEPKLDRARRQIPEWVEYDTEIANLLSDKPVDESTDDSNSDDHDEL
ncbi:transferase activity protein [[Candida] boidinii]|nr:transferase activity protein [[Candida] boidinii]